MNLINTHEAAKYLGVSYNTLKKYRITGGGPPFFKIGRSIRYAIEDLEKYLNIRKFDNTAGYVGCIANV